jgi:membrane-bound metal-dependent hydrolase YbcI (DUF457 family)
MWPWGHLAVGYLVYSFVAHLGYRRRPGDRATLAVAIGTQFPDLVDKPLAWTLAVLPNGRSLTHSLFVALVILTILQIVLRSRGSGEIATAFGVGYLSHLATDALYPALAGDYHQLLFLAWPAVPPVEYATEQSFAAHLSQLTLDAFVAAELGLGVVAFAVWLADGAPGLGAVTAIPRWVRGRLTA